MDEEENWEPIPCGHIEKGIQDLFEYLNDENARTMRASQ
jgi:hypothetical protein